MNACVRQLIHPDDDTVDTIALWMYRWWGRREGHTPEAVRRYVQNSCQERRLPQTYGLFLQDRLIGLYQFRLDDLFVRPDLYPWLANVYVDAPFRGRGYGRILMESVRENAAQHLPWGEIFLYTAHTGLYEKYGWEFIAPIDTHLPQQRMQRLYRLSLD